MEQVIENKYLVIISSLKEENQKKEADFEEQVRKMEEKYIEVEVKEKTNNLMIEKLKSLNEVEIREKVISQVQCEKLKK